MDWTQRIYTMMNSPVGVSFHDGTGTSGILCNVQNGIVYLIEYMYRDQFALKQYPYYTIQDINTFPSCHNIPGPTPLPFPGMTPPRLY